MASPDYDFWLLKEAGDYDREEETDCEREAREEYEEFMSRDN